MSAGLTQPAVLATLESLPQPLCLVEHSRITSFQTYEGWGQCGQYLSRRCGDAADHGMHAGSSMDLKYQGASTLLLKNLWGKLSHLGVTMHISGRAVWAPATTRTSRGQGTEEAHRAVRGDALGRPKAMASPVVADQLIEILYSCVRNVF